MKAIILILAIVLAVSASAWAGDCSLNLDAATAAVCDREYAAGVATCERVHPNPMDYDNRTMCINYSKDVYKKCTGDCSGYGYNK